MPPKKSVNKNAAVDLTSPGVTQATTDGPSVVTEAPTVTPPVSQVQDATAAAAPMEIDDAAVSNDAHYVNGLSDNQSSNVSNNNPVVVSAVPVNHDVINDNASVASPPDVGIIHGDVPRTSV
ncbi:hypothetical protein V8B55DRAFT_1571760 [Mucor lusitanicus]|uniref:Uncharacterized protein n=1 Tax=Mucor lusitanicus CBS 277.49 TaxID=747725 RepID=A0A162R2D9_MUCCL|nr:hypothetical protein MUCCIDRAFT_157925 [Mucor lusitanicus CBS 277.49]